MKQILYLTQLLPYPPNTGGKYKTLEILKILAKKYEVHLVSMVDKEEELINGKVLLSYCRCVKSFVVPVITMKHRKLKLKVITSLFTVKPFIIYKFYSKAVQEHLTSLFKQNNFEIIYIEHSSMVQYIPNSFKGRLIYDEHNVSHLAYLSYAQQEPNLFLRIFFLIESFKLKLYESKSVKRFDHIFAISKFDMCKIIELGFCRKNISVLPVPFEYKLLFKYHLYDPVILFVGTLSWRPNEKGIIWFIKNVFPKIIKLMPNAKLIIVGINGEWLKPYLTNRNIEYCGYIKDLSRVYKKTSVFIVPIHIGGGIRIKLLHAMSSGIPIVSTSKGAEGIEVTNGKEILIEDKPEEFVNAILKVLQNRKIANRLSFNSLKFIKKNYSTEMAAKTLSTYL